MNEEFFKEDVHDEPLENIDVLLDAVIDVKLGGIKLPQVGTPAHTRLYGLCKKYSDAVHEDVMGKIGIRKGVERRKLHDELCKMLYGTDYNNTSGKNITKISNFAHLVAGREQYMI